MTTCTRCNRPLNNPASVINGMGPICWRKSFGDRDATNKQAILDFPFKQHGLVCCRPNGDVQTNIPHQLVYHSPTGFEWGYAGSGPADLALNVLLLAGVDREAAFRWHQTFKERFIVDMPREGGHVPFNVIEGWINMMKTKED